MTGGRPDPSDASTVTFTYTLNQQPRCFRIHLFDEAKSGMPRMAMESLLTTGRICQDAPDIRP